MSPSARWGWRDGVAVLSASTFVTIVVWTTSIDLPLSHDENFTLFHARGSFDDLGAGVSREHNMGLHDLALWLWLRPGGGLGAARWLSTVFAVAVVVLTYAVARRLLDSNAALFAVTLLVLNDMFLEWAGFARGYTLAMAGVVLSMLALVHTLEGPHRGWGATQVAAATVAVYAHTFSITVVVAQIVALTFLARGNPLAAAARWRAVVVLVLSLPLLLAMSLEDDDKWSWIPSLGYEAVRGVLGGITGRGGLPEAIPYLAGAALAGWGLLRVLRSTSSREHPSGVLLATWALVPVGLMLVVTLVLPLLVARYLLVVVPGLVIAEALGIRHLERRVRLIAAGLLLLAAAWGTVTYVRDGPALPGGEMQQGEAPSPSQS